MKHYNLISLTLILTLVLPVCPVVFADIVDPDFTYAIEMGYVDSSFSSRDVHKTIISTEYKSMLSDMIAKIAPDKIEWFNSKVTDYTKTLTRGLATTMSWYAAVAIGADNYNYDFDHTKADGGDFWEQPFMPFEKLFPDCHKDTLPVTVDSLTWRDEFTASFLWNLWHVSEFSQKQVIAFDEEAGSMRTHDPFTVEEAVCAVARLYPSISSEITDLQIPATVLSARKDAELRADLQARIDEIQNTETEIVHSDTFIPGETYTGTAYYISNDGDDRNDGLTPETAWRSLNRILECNGYYGENGMMFQPGDAVFFRRGDVFRLSELGESAPLHIWRDGVTYSAYGDGAKPIITASSENGTGSEKWKLNYEDETGKKIWQYYRDMRDISRIVLNDGEAITTRVYEFYDENGYISCEATGWWMHDENGVTLLDRLLPPEESLKEDLSIISRPARIRKGDNDYSPDMTVGPLYLRCDAGNPGELYGSVEFTEYYIQGIAYMVSSGVVFDNISFRCGGNSYIKPEISWKEVQNTVIQNCEFAYGGATVTNYTKWDNGFLIVEVQGDGIYNLVRNTTIQNNYFHDAASTCGTYEGDNFNDTDAVDGYYRYIDNVSVNTLGIRLDSTSVALQYLDSVKVCGNQVWNTGRMDRGKLMYSEGALALMHSHYDEWIIEDNVFYGTENGHPTNALLNVGFFDVRGSGFTQPQFGNNIYVQYAGRNFGDFQYQNGEAWAMDDPGLVTKAAELLGDTTSEFYLF